MEYEYWFANIKGIGNQKKRSLREQVSHAKDLYYIEETKLFAMGMTQKELEAFRKSKENWSVKQEYEQLKRKGVQFYTMLDEQYPKRLLDISAPPYALYVKGKLPEENRISVSIVGARECSAYGREMAGRFAKELAQAGAQIISGMARGIDGSAQWGALEGAGAVFGVLGCGVDVCYPREHMELYMNLQKAGGLISEQPIGEQPLPRYFPARNRIISGLSDVVLVMEAKEKSGSLITVDMALEQGKDVYALPGPISSRLSIGCNRLIKQGAGILISPEDLLEDLMIASKESVKKILENKISLETTENMVYSCLGLYPISVSQLSEMTDLPIPKLMSVLVGLELKGYIQEISKNYYTRLK